MEALKKFFPFSFAKKNDVTALVISILIQLAVGVVAGVLIGVLAKIPIVGIIAALAGGLVDLYVVVSIVLTVLDYLKVLK